MRDYKFENLIIKGKRYNLVIHDAVNFQNACIKVVNYFVKNGTLQKSEFKTNLNYLKQNLEKGETRITPLKSEKHLDLDLEGKSFDDTYDILYNGLIKEKNS